MIRDLIRHRWRYVLTGALIWLLVIWLFLTALFSFQAACS